MCEFNGISKVCFFIISDLSFDCYKLNQQVDINIFGKIIKVYCMKCVWIFVYFIGFVMVKFMK